MTVRLLWAGILVAPTTATVVEIGSTSGILEESTVVATREYLGTATDTADLNCWKISGHSSANLPLRTGLLGTSTAGVGVSSAPVAIWNLTPAANEIPPAVRHSKPAIVDQDATHTAITATVATIPSSAYKFLLFKSRPQQRFFPSLAHCAILRILWKV